MKIPRFCLLFSLSMLGMWAQGLEVGTGAPNDVARQQFAQAYFRGGFASLVSLPPLGPVRSFGSTGLIQEFASATNSNSTLALVRNTTSSVLSEATSAFQVRASMYSYYTSLGVSTVGFPTMDTVPCPSLTTTTCQYQLFDKGYALFVYTGQNLAVTGTILTKWTSLGGISVLGAATTAERTVSSVTGTTASYQGFTQGAIFDITSGTLNGRFLAVKQPVYSLFVDNGGHTGFLGFPTGEEILAPNGLRRQTFEGGAVEYSPGSNPVLRLPVYTVAFRSLASPIRMNLGDTLPVNVLLFAPNGTELTSRDVAWTTSNSRVVSIDASGTTAILRAVGGGIATVTAISEGKSSPQLSVFVTAPCCQIGEGAPTPALQQAFQDAVTRNSLALRLPSASPVRRVGGGYVQDFLAADPSSSARYLVAKSDRAAGAFVIAGVVLARYQELGGPAGSLGYPVSDATPGGRQLFENGALAGNPVVRVSGPILTRWATLGYETGLVGAPAGEAVPVLTFAATDGAAQNFANGGLYATLSGPLAGKAFFVTGLIHSRYNALGGPAGQFGLPVGEEGPFDGKRRQDFEGGSLEYAPGDTEASVAPQDKRPQVRTNPVSVAAGGRVRIAVGGFQPGGTLRISMTDRPDFLVTTQVGAYSWEIFIPSAAPSGAIAIRAVDTSSLAEARGSFQVIAAAEVRLRLVKLQGDSQTGLPGALLSQPLRAALRDEAGNPMADMAVRFFASPGGSIEAASTVTDVNGEAQAMLRLPLAEGVALATAAAGRQVVTFSARVAASTLPNFPKLTQAVDQPLGSSTATIAEQGALLTAAAAIIRYHQDRGDLVSSNGFADPSLLNDFLKNFCVFDTEGRQICDGFLVAPGSQEPVVNLWRLGAFVASSIDVAVLESSLERIRDALAQGSPVLLALSMSADSAPAGSHFVVATGVQSGGSIVVHDPSPSFARSTLDEYLTGFTAGSRNWKATLAGAVRLVPLSPSASGFLLAGDDVTFNVTSPAGVCGKTIGWPNVAAVVGPPPAEAPGAFRFRYCGGTQTVYQVDLGGQGSRSFTLTDLANPGSRSTVSASSPASFQLTRPATQWIISPLTASFTAAGVVNAASFLPELAPGSLAAIFGSGLASRGGATTVEIGGHPAPVVTASPFQVNVDFPLDLPPGAYTLRLRSPYGASEQSVRLRSAAPAIFLLGGQQGAILNQDSTVNGPGNAARRGQVIVIFCTGLGAVSNQGAFQVAQSPVEVLLEGQPLDVSFAGLTPGFPGLYQVNVQIPATTPPGLNLKLKLRQAGAESNTALVSIE